MYCGRIEPSILSGHLPYPWEQENREGRLRDEMREGRSRYGERVEGETCKTLEGVSCQGWIVHCVLGGGGEWGSE